VQQKIEDEDEDEDDFRNMAKTLPPSPLICGICGFSFGRDRSDRSDMNQKPKKKK
jgi:hypothetical protein